MKHLLILFVTAGFLLTACSPAGSDINLGEPILEESMLKITSSAFDNQTGIPQQYTCDGEDINPPLSWSGVPDETASLVLIMDDPDAPVGTWDHWLLYNIPASANGLPENAQTLPEGTLVGQNGWNNSEYGGPCPPGSSSHRYFFKLYALNTTLDLPAGASKNQLTAAMQDHVLAQAELVGIYQPE